MMKTIFLWLGLSLFLTPVLLSQNAPVVTAGRITTAVPGDPSVPVAYTVTGFTNIAQFTLTMKFDTTKVRYVSAVPNPALSGMTVTYTSPSGNTLGKLVMAWTGTGNVSLADGSSLADLTFHYINGTGILSWAFTFGSVCQFKRYVGTTLTSLADAPKYHYYLNGGISNRSAPVAMAPELADPLPGPLPLPVAVNGFSDIGTFTLYLEYDPAIITYLNSFTKNPAFDLNFLVGDNPGIDGKRFIVIQWYGSSVSLADGAVLCTLDFNYPVATCSSGMLNWFDAGPSCEFADGPGNVLIDMPQQEYYANGLVAEGLPVTWTGHAGTAWEDAGNWTECGTPGKSRHVLIPDVAPDSFPVISDTVYCRSITIQPGAAMTVSSGGAITVGD